MNPALIILAIAGISLLLSIIFYGLRNPKGSLHDTVQNSIKAEDIEKRFKRFNRLKKISFYFGILLLLASAAMEIIPRLI